MLPLHKLLHTSNGSSFYEPGAMSGCLKCLSSSSAVTRASGSRVGASSDVTYGTSVVWICEIAAASQPWFMEAFSRSCCVHACNLQRVLNHFVIFGSMVAPSPGEDNWNGNRQPMMEQYLNIMKILTIGYFLSRI